jgi:hypothetical protein
MIFSKLIIYFYSWLRTVVLNNLQLTDIQLLKFLKLLNCHETAMRFWNSQVLF